MKSDRSANQGPFSYATAFKVALAALLAATVGACAKSTSSSPDRDTIRTEKSEPNDRKVETGFPRESAKGPSANRAILESLMKRAQDEHKILVYESSAAWCGPCTQFAFDLHEHPEKLKELSDAGYIVAKHESETTYGLVQGAISDDEAIVTRYFPAFVTFTPGQGWKFLGTANSVDKLLTSLKAVKDQPILSVDEVKKYLQANTTDESAKALTETDKARFSMSMGAISANYTYKQAKEMLTFAKSLDAKFPDRSIANQIAFTAASAIDDYLAIGAVDMTTFQQDFPQEAKAFLDPTDESFSLLPWLLNRIFAVRDSGAASAYKTCDSSYQTYRSHIQRGSLSEADFAKKMQTYDLQSVGVCTNFQVLAEGSSPEAQKKVESIGVAKIKDWVLLSRAGFKNEAIAAYQKAFVNFKSFYMKYKTEYQEKATKERPKAKRKTRKPTHTGSINTPTSRITTKALIKPSRQPSKTEPKSSESKF